MTHSFSPPPPPARVRAPGLRLGVRLRRRRPRPATTATCAARRRPRRHSRQLDVLDLVQWKAPQARLACRVEINRCAAHHARGPPCQAVSANQLVAYIKQQTLWQAVRRRTGLDRERGAADGSGLAEPASRPTTVGSHGGRRLIAEYGPPARDEPAAGVGAAQPQHRQPVGQLRPKDNPQNPHGPAKKQPENHVGRGGGLHSRQARDADEVAVQGGATVQGEHVPGPGRPDCPGHRR